MERYSIESYKDKSKKTPAKKQSSGLSNSQRTMLIAGILYLVLFLLLGFFIYKTFQLNSLKNKLLDENKSLQSQLDSLRRGSNINGQPSASSDTGSKGATQAQKDSIIGVLNSKNLSDIKPYLAPSVQVVRTGGTTLSGLTPEQVISQLAYLADAAPPWLLVSGSTLTAWQNGPYGSYFGAGTTVFQSSNNYVVSFDFTPDGQIDTVFMTNDSGVLSQTTGSSQDAPVSQPNNGTGSE